MGTKEESCFSGKDKSFKGHYLFGGVGRGLGWREGGVTLKSQKFNGKFYLLTGLFWWHSYHSRIQAHMWLTAAVFFLSWRWEFWAILNEGRTSKKVVQREGIRTYRRNWEGVPWGMVIHVTLSPKEPRFLKDEEKKEEKLKQFSLWGYFGHGFVFHILVNSVPENSVKKEVITHPSGRSHK